MKASKRWNGTAQPKTSGAVFGSRAFWDGAERAPLLCLMGLYYLAKLYLEMSHFSTAPYFKYFSTCKVISHLVFRYKLYWARKRERRVQKLVVVRVC